MNSFADRSLGNRRFAQRHNVKTALRVHIWKSAIPEQRGESVNLSQRGIYFVTNSAFSEGEAVEILLKMPEVVTGEPPTEWRCTGLVTRVEPVDSQRGTFGVGVRFDCYEIARRGDPQVHGEVSALGLGAKQLTGELRE